MLKTVRVPAEIEPIFAAAEEAVSSFFKNRKDHPEHGTIEILGERYILVRAASLSVEFFGLVEQLFGPGRETAADQFARNILFDLAHALGKSDARNFQKKMHLESPLAKLSAGPVIFSHTGWAFVDILPESRPLPNDDYYLLFDHPYSCESDAWLRAGKTRDFPVCIMNAGWSSGWCEESFGVQVVSVEVMCRARGDETCRFIMAPPKRIEEYARAFDAARSGATKTGGGYEIPDFFARKRAEEELRGLYERLKELDTLKTQLFANVSHELRTPLMLISGPVEKLLADPHLTADQRSSLEVVQRNAGILLKHVNDLLDVAKLEAGRTDVRHARTDLAWSSFVWWLPTSASSRSIPADHLPRRDCTEPARRSGSGQDRPLSSSICSRTRSPSPAAPSASACARRTSGRFSRSPTTGQAYLLRCAR